MVWRARTSRCPAPQLALTLALAVTTPAVSARLLSKVGGQLAQGSGRSRNKQLARQVASAALLSTLLETVPAEDLLGGSKGAARHMQQRAEAGGRGGASWISRGGPGGRFGAAGGRAPEGGRGAAGWIGGRGGPGGRFGPGGRGERPPQFVKGDWNGPAAPTAEGPGGWGGFKPGAAPVQQPVQAAAPGALGGGMAAGMAQLPQMAGIAGEPTAWLPSTCSSLHAGHAMPT